MRKIVIICCLLLCVTGLPGSLWGQTNSITELQAVYLFNFAKYIKWPENESPTFNIGVYSKTNTVDEFSNVLKGKKIHGRQILVTEVESEEDLSILQILYISSTDSKKFTYVLPLLEGKNVLIVTEEESLIRKGAMISFFQEKDKLRFKLNRNLLTKAGLSPAEGLLKLAVLY